MIRFVLSVFICFVGGSLFVGIVNGAHASAGAKFFVPAGLFTCLMVASLVLVWSPWKLETTVNRLVTLMVCFYAGLGLGAWAEHQVAPATPATPSAGQMVLSVLCMQGSLLVFVALFLRRQRLGWSEAFGLAHRRWRALLAGAAAAVLFLRLGLWLQQISVELLMRWSHERPEEQLPVQALRNAAGMGDRMVLGALTILLVPVAEELLFRGILYPWIKQLGYPRAALWGTSLLFAAFHLSVPPFLPLFVLAMLLTALYEWSDNLLAPITAHALFNALNLILLYHFDKQP